MKKLIALLLVLTFCIVAFAGCRDDEGSSSTNSATGEIDALAADGKLDNIKYGLGADIDDVKKYYSDLEAEFLSEHTDEDGHNHDEEFVYYNFEKKSEYSVIDISSARFYFENTKQDKGISVIATDSETFGFTPGVTTKYEVEDSVKAEGETFNATDDELRFLAVRTEPVLVLRYEYEDYTLDFYFYENTLITTVLTNTDNWKL